MEDFLNYITNKSICIVGPSNNLLNTNYGKKINKYDIVIKLNKFYKITNIKDYGNKINIYAYNFYEPIYINMLKHYNIQYILSTFPQLNNDINENINQSLIKNYTINHIIYPQEFFDELKVHYQHNIIPTSGLTTIYFFLKHIHLLKKLHIYGISFDYIYNQEYNANCNPTFNFHNMQIDNMILKDILNDIYKKDKTTKKKIKIF